MDISRRLTNDEAPPRILVSADIDDGHGSRRHFLNESYAAALYRAGGVPFITPAPDIRFSGSYAALAETALGAASGLLLSGGDDVNALLYGGENRPFNGVFTEERDRFEIELCRAAVRAQKPILGICRGIQLLNVALGGALFQDIETEFTGKPDGKAVLMHRQKAPSWSAVHTVTLLRGSLAGRVLLGADKDAGAGDTEAVISVNSFHHQAVRDIAPGLTVSARSRDGVIEAIEPAPDGAEGSYGRPHPFTLGLQWHPERMDAHHEHARRLFSAFIEVCCAVGR
jgi:putative glutamine amidotransferase